MMYVFLFSILFFSTIFVISTNHDNIALASHNGSHYDDEKMYPYENRYHLPPNSMCAPGFATIQDICVLNDRCGPGAYVGKVCVMDEKVQPYLKPLHQKHIGISADNIICAEGLELIQKYDDSPACVSSETAIALIQRGWSLPVSESSKILMFTSLEHSTEQNDNDDGYSYGETEVNDAKLNVASKIIAEKNYLVFDGVGWHGLHNVEITITNHDDGEQITSIRSKTNDHGILYMPWHLPEGGLPNGFYDIRADDGINQKTLKILISDIPINSKIDSSELKVEVNGDKQVRRGTTHSIEVQVTREQNPVDNADVYITIEDYGEDVIREFHGYTNHGGYFVFSWEIPKSFDDVETLLAFVDVTDGVSSKTKLFKFQVYCIDGEKGCKVDGN